MRTFSLLLVFALIGLCLGCQSKPTAESTDESVSKAPDVEPVYDGKTLSEWMALTKNKDPKVQRKATLALGNFRAMGVPPLMAMLQDDSDVRKAAELRDGPADVNDTLPDDDSYGHKAAAQALGKIGPEAKAAIPMLIALLRDRSYFVQEAAAAALGEIGQVDVPTLGQVRKDAGEVLVPTDVGDAEGSEVWRASVVVLLTTGPQAEAAAPALRELLKGENLPQIHLAALLGYIGKTAVPTFTKLLKDKDVVVRRRAAEILGYIGPEAKAAVPALVESLKDADWATRWRATMALGHVGPAAKAAVPALIESLKSMGAPYVAEALEKIGLDVKTDVPALIELVKNHNEEAARILGNIGPPAKAAIPALTESFKDENGEVRCAAALAVWKISGEAKAVVPLLTDLLGDKQVVVRNTAAHALEHIGPAAEPAIAALVKLFDDKEQGNAIAASKALGKIGPAAIPAIMQFLNDKNKKPSARRQAVLVLWQMGSVAVPSFTELLKDEDIYVRQVAAKALKKINQEKR